jgi:hypothetical protein
MHVYFRMHPLFSTGRLLWCFHTAGEERVSIHKQKPGGVAATALEACATDYSYYPE